jgi:hypothetical protein
MNKLVEGKGNPSVEKLKDGAKEITSWKDISKSWTRWKSTIKLKSDEKFLGILLAVFVLSVISYFTFVYHATYSEGVRSGQLIKFSTRSRFKTWEGEISQGMSGSQIFFLCNGQRQTSNYWLTREGRTVRKIILHRTLQNIPMVGDTKYFVIAVQENESPFKSK